jgi:hypothetical protein
MSAPTRAQLETDDATQDLSWPAETFAGTNIMNPETGRENDPASAKPRVVRTLKAPPEIWDLVHEAPKHFNPSGAFFARLTSTKTNLVLLTLTVILISGLVAFAVMTLSDSQNSGGEAAQVQEELGASPVSKGSAPANAPASVQNVPVDAPLATDLNTQPGAEYPVDNTQPTDSQPAVPQLPDPQPTHQEVDNPAAAGAAVTNSIQPTAVSVSNISQRTASGAAAVLPGNKRVTVGSVGQNAYRSRPAREENETAASPNAGTPPKTSGTSRTPQTADLKRSDEKGSSDSASAGSRSATSSPQAIAPTPTSPAPKANTPKAKVIQWP